jgi:hypothetical protein
MVITYACNPSYLGDSDRRILVSGQAEQKKLVRLYLNEQAGYSDTCQQYQLLGRER